MIYDIIHLSAPEALADDCRPGYYVVAHIPADAAAYTIARFDWGWPAKALLWFLNRMRPV